MVNYECAFSQSQLGKYFEWKIRINNGDIESIYLATHYTLTSPGLEENTVLSCM